MTYSRRDMCLLIATLAAARDVGAGNTSLPGKAYPYTEMHMQKNGENEFRPILSGELHTGCYVEVHQTRLAPGSMPHPAHHHLHEEMFMIREGTIEMALNGKTTQLGPGSVGFAGSNDEHGLRNAGTTPAEYFVVAFGKDA